MKKFVLFGLVIFSGVLAACSQDSEVALKGLGYSGVPVVTDVEGLSEPLSQVLDARFAPTAKLAGAAAEYGAGVVSYDITRDLVWPPIWIDPEEGIPKPNSSSATKTVTLNRTRAPAL